MPPSPVTTIDLRFGTVSRHPAEEDLRAAIQAEIARIAGDGHVPALSVTVDVGPGVGVDVFRERIRAAVVAALRDWVHSVGGTRPQRVGQAISLLEAARLAATLDPPDTCCSLAMVRQVEAFLRPLVGDPLYRRYGSSREFGRVQQACTSAVSGVGVLSERLQVGTADWPRTIEGVQGAKGYLQEMNLESTAVDDETEERRSRLTPDGARIGSQYRNMGELQTGVRGTRDIAGAAEALLAGVRCGRVSPLTWTNDSDRRTLSGRATEEQWIDCRHMSCYEFVHYCAWLSSERPATSRGVNWNIASYALYSSRGIAGEGFQEWDRSSTIPRGMVVIGIARAYNNQSGFYHTGISDGAGNVIGLGSGGFTREAVGDCFGRMGYTQVLYGAYRWPKAPS